MSEYDPQQAAAILHQFRAGRQIVVPLPDHLAPKDEQQGAAVQRELANRIGSALPAGFKIGATARRMQEYLGLSGPAAGFISTSGVLAPGSTVKYGDYVHPGVECEIAVRLGRDLPPGPCTQQQAAEAVDQLVAGIEIVDNRYEDLAVLGTPTLIADQVFHAAAVVGSPGPVDWHNLDFEDLPGHITVNGQRVGEGRASDLMGHPLNGLAWLAASPVAAAFGGLKAGQVVMLGSVTPPIWLTGPSSVTVEFAPLPPVSVRLV
jgi:2-keto-4-pentenoate hydratase